MNKINEILKQIDPDVIKKVFIDIVESYLYPSFSAISKREIDILLFSKLQELNVFGERPDIYKLVTDLKITRSKARNLLYESKLRAVDSSELDKELKYILLSPKALKIGENVAIEIDNPLLIDHLRAVLKELNHSTDGSFFPELVKLSEDAYISLFKNFLPKEHLDSITKVLIELKVITDKSFKGLLKGVLVKIGDKMASEAGVNIASLLYQYLEPIMSGNLKEIKEKFI